MTLLLALIAFGAQARGAEAVPASPEAVAAAAAETDRLSGEIRSLAARQIWSGVERKYRQAITLGSPLEGEIHLVAAYSARDRGDLLAVYERLSRAASQGASKEIVDWLWDLDHNFGSVNLNADRKGTALLSMAQMPLDPSRRQAVEAAIAMCRDSGEFRGLLPRGDYKFSGQEFRVEPGISVRVEVSPKVRRQGIQAPTIVYRELPTAQGQEKN